jgi:hypothetical protein
MKYVLPLWADSAAAPARAANENTMSRLESVRKVIPGTPIIVFKQVSSGGSAMCPNGRQRVLAHSCYSLVITGLLRRRQTAISGDFMIP